MYSKKRKSPRIGAYLPYVTIRGLELDAVFRQKAKFLTDDSKRKNQIQPTILLSLDDAGGC